jgi:ABC-type bacteriocin/lantibiotic exporter with double-glycine peptidase domain
MNKKAQSIISLLRGLWIHFTLRRKWQFTLLLCLMLITSFAEILNIGSFMPLIAIMINPDKIFNDPRAQPFISYVGFNSSEDLLIPAVLFFAVIVIITNGLRLFLLWGGTRLSNLMGSDLSVQALRATLYQPYIVHISRNSSEVISGLGKVSGLVLIINTLFTLLGSMIIFISILIGLLYLSPLVAIIFFGGFGFMYFVVILFTKNKLLISGTTIAEESNKSTRLLQESLGGIRDILIDGTQEIYCNAFKETDKKSRYAQATIQIVGGSPRFFMETFGLLLILSLAIYLIVNDGGVEAAIPILATFGFAAQRLLPVAQNIYGAWAGIQGSRASFEDALGLLNQRIPTQLKFRNSRHALPFDRQIELSNISFRYTENSKWVIDKLSLLIPKGARIGLIGKTGCGKSTLLDILMGLISPIQGELKVDDKIIDDNNRHLWQKHVSHVPQSIFLADASVIENIAFGIPLEFIDLSRVQKAAEMAQISNVIEEWPSKYKTRIGERGVRLSGGQRQRIGLARAFYKGADLIILDEATSALDSETEEAVMASIDALKEEITVIIVAHRLTTLKNCSSVIDLKNGNIFRTGAYNDICKI